MEQLIEKAKLFKCHICDKEYNYKAGLSTHFKKVHAEIQMIQTKKKRLNVIFVTKHVTHKDI